MRLRSALLAVACLGSSAAALVAPASAAPASAPKQAATELAPHVADVVLVGFRPGATGLERAAARRTVSAVASERISPLAPDAEKWVLPRGYGVERALAALGRAKGVRYVEPDYIVTKQVTSDDPYVTNGTLWGMYGDASSPANQYGSQAAEAWASGYIGSSSVAIGVIDEGIQVTHPDLVDNIWVNTAEQNGTAGVDDDGNGYIDDINGWDFVTNDASVYDGGSTGSADSHGTHVSGTIGGVGGNGIGVAGVNWDVTIISGKFLGTSGGSTSNATRAVDYMTDLKTRHGLNIVATSNSWGGGGASQTLLDAINRGGNNNILFVAAAGNSTTNNDATASYPSNYQCTTAQRAWDCVVAVAAIASNGTIASFSSYGATTVDIGAPGVSIMSSLPFNTYGSYSGTSMATPHVSGAVALCASLNPALTGAQLRSAVLSTTQPTTSLVGKVVNSGRLDVSSMVTTCAGSAGPISGDPSNLAASTTSATRMNLTWTDGVTNELNWTIQRALSTSSVCGSFSTVATLGANVTSFTDSGLTGSTTYCYRVQASGTGGSTNWSNTATATTATPPPPYVCSATTYSWLDPTIGGTLRTLADDGSVSVTLPFTVTWFGVDQTSVNVSSNGYIRFGSGAATAYSNTAIPDASDPNNMAAAWWDDLNPAAGGSVYTSVQGTSPSRRFVTSWVDINPYGTTGNPVSFQIVVDEATDAVTFQYLDASAAAGSSGSSATVGVENGDATNGTQISFNSASIASGTAYRCTDNAGPTPVVVSTSSLPVGTTGTGYSSTLAASGGSGSYSWSVTSGSVPTGLTLNANGTLTGTPSATGSFTFEATATDTASASGAKSFTVTVANPVTVSTASPMPGATLNSAYSQTLAATGGTGSFTWARTAGTLPTGLTLSSAGLLSGTPTAGGTFSFTVTATDGAGRTGSKAMSVTVAAAPGAFAKSGPKNLATKQRTSLSLSWAASTGATSYEYCLTTTPPTAGQTTCSSAAGWVSTGTSRTVTVTLSRLTTYYWQVRAVNSTGTTYANTGTWWRFTTG